MSSDLKPLTLHGHSTGPNPYKVAVVLEVLGIPYNVKLWQISDDDKNGVKGAKFVAINPNGRVPALEDPNTGVISWESLACINYLVRVYDKTNKLGPKADAGEQAKVDFDKWTSLLITTLGPMQGQINFFKHFDGTNNEGAIKRYETQTYRCYGVLEKHLKEHGGDWIIPGSEPSLVDVHYGPWINLYGFAGLSLDEYPAVKAWLDRFNGHSAVAQAYKKVKAGEEA